MDVKFDEEWRACGCEDYSFISYLHPSAVVVVKFLTLNTVELPCATTSCERPPPITDC